jgi:hypothetical protein
MLDCILMNLGPNIQEEQVRQDGGPQASSCEEY